MYAKALMTPEGSLIWELHSGTGKTDRQADTQRHTHTSPPPPFIFCAPWTLSPFEKGIIALPICRGRAQPLQVWIQPLLSVISIRPVHRKAFSKGSLSSHYTALHRLKTQERPQGCLKKKTGSHHRPHEGKLIGWPRKQMGAYWLSTQYLITIKGS